MGGSTPPLPFHTKSVRLKQSEKEKELWQEKEWLQEQLAPQLLKY